MPAFLFLVARHSEQREESIIYLLANHVFQLIILPH